MNLGIQKWGGSGLQSEKWWFGIDVERGECLGLAVVPILS